MICVITIVLFSLISFVSISQTDHSSQLRVLRFKFPKQELVAGNNSTIISFILNIYPKPGFAKTSILVRPEIAIVPLIVLRKK